MSKKLFAFEEAEIAVADDLEVTQPEGEVADVQVDVDADVAEIGDMETAITEGMGAADQLQDTEEMVEATVDETAGGDSEGLTEVAAEAIRIAVEAIAARVNYDPKRVYSLYATENFASPSSRVANTKYALEGIGQFLKDLWKKIKVMFSKMMDKARAFWNKHASSLGRVKKALEAMKVKITASSGKLNGSSRVEDAPSSLVSAFAGTDDISAATVQKYIDAHKNATLFHKVSDASQSISKELAAWDAIKFSKKDDVKTMLQKVTDLLDLSMTGDGSKSAAFIGGVTMTIEGSAKATDEDMSVTYVKGEIEDKKDVLALEIAEKSKLLDLIKNTTAVINDTIKLRDEGIKVEDAFNKAMQRLDSTISKMSDEAKDDAKKEGLKGVRKSLKHVYSINAMCVRINTDVFSLNVKLAKCVIGYCGFCVKQFKAAA